jgi:hypothetical protein
LLLVDFILRHTNPLFQERVLGSSNIPVSVVVPSTSWTNEEPEVFFVALFLQILFGDEAQ